MKKFQLIAFLLAGGMLAGCSSSGGTDTSAASTTVTVTPSATTTSADPEQTPVGAITPGEAKDHLVQNGNVYTLYSPDGTLAIEIDTAEQMSYSVYRVRDGETTEWVRESTLGVEAGRKTYYKDATVTSATATEVEVSYPLYGNQRTADGHCMEAVLSLSQGDYSYWLEVRAYDDGVAFRYVLPELSSVTALNELTTYALRTDIEQCWYGVNNQDYEPVIESHSPTRSSNDVICAPLTAELKDGRGYIAIMEGALNESYPGVNLKAEGKSTYSTCFYTTPTVSTGTLTSGWRLINIADDLNGLVNNYNVYTVNEAADETLYADTSWIEAGRSAWSWCTTHGAPTYEQMKEYIVAAAKLGYEYNIIDDGWPAWNDYKALLTDLGVMGEELNVKQLLWGTITAGTSGYNKTPDEGSVNAYLQLLSDAHMYGAKVDFWWSDANTNTTALQKYILEEAAKLQMIIDFHGCNKNTGLNVTYPNELSREGVRGLENIGNSNTTNYSTYAAWLNAQLYTRFLCGHADWTPGTYNAMEIASLICIDSPLMVVASDPEDILASPAVEFIKSIPTVWDKTVVLSDSRIGKYSVYAKENNGTWFIGGIASSNVSGAKVDLAEFLPDGTYTAEVWVDGADGMEKTVVTVTGGDVINIDDLTSGKGYAIRISKLSLSQYGGAIGTIAVTAPDCAVVKYTVDGSDPMTSSTAVAAGETITLTASCRLQVAIVEGDGKGTLLSYQFNEIDPVHTFKSSMDYEDGKTIVSLSVAEGATIHYTLDGSTPTASSPVAGDSIVITDTCTLRYLIVSGNETKEGSLDVKVTKQLTAPKSDLALTDAKPTSKSIGWGNAHFDTSMSPDNGMGTRPISLGGTNVDNGTKFDRGISSNSVSTYTYAVPEGYTRFVGVVGIDDCVYNNTASCGEAKSTLSIAFNGAVVYTSEAFRMGEYVYFDVEVPAGATTMTITFGDGGNGATCDNVSLAMPGWVK
ncbi:MAG: glycoside hydrolase family 97 N-terminal domain-containing protein [Clostridia bacterium]|nr:glycoside hydrolase family 97 N-terminal domain-containing protein [Clostridia bacterium]